MAAIHSPPNDDRPPDVAPRPSFLPLAPHPPPPHPPIHPNLVVVVVCTTICCANVDSPPSLTTNTNTLFLPRKSFPRFSSSRPVHAAVAAPQPARRSAAPSARDKRDRHDSRSAPTPQPRAPSPGPSNPSSQLVPPLARTHAHTTPQSSPPVTSRLHLRLASSIHHHHIDPHLHLSHRRSLSLSHSYPPRTPFLPWHRSSLFSPLCWPPTARRPLRPSLLKASHPDRPTTPRRRADHPPNLPSLPPDPHLPPSIVVHLRSPFFKVTHHPPSAECNTLCIGHVHGSSSSTTSITLPST